MNCSQEISDVNGTYCCAGTGDHTVHFAKNRWGFVILWGIGSGHLPVDCRPSTHWFVRNSTTGSAQIGPDGTVEIDDGPFLGVFRPGAEVIE